MLLEQYQTVVQCPNSYTLDGIRLKMEANVTRRDIGTTEFMRRIDSGRLLGVSCSTKPRNLELFIGMWQF